MRVDCRDRARTRAIAVAYDFIGLISFDVCSKKENAGCTGPGCSRFDWSSMDRTSRPFVNQQDATSQRLIKTWSINFFNVLNRLIRKLK